jgi:hypothetical protein
VASYVTDGFHRLNPRPVIGTQFLDLEAAPGVNYEYQVRAVDASGNVSTNFSGEGAVTVTAIAGVATGENATWPGSFYRRDFTPPRRRQSRGWCGSIGVRIRKRIWRAITFTAGPLRLIRDTELF